VRSKIFLGIFVLTVFLVNTVAYCAPQIKILSKTSKASHEWDDGFEVIPDATLVYRTTFQNNGDEPAKAVVLKDEIPAHTTFVLKSVKASSEIKVQYFDKSTKAWTDKAPTNPTKIQSLKVTFQKNIKPAQNQKDVEWMEYAVKVNY